MIRFTIFLIEHGSLVEDGGELFVCCAPQNYRFVRGPR
jgi:hypothetical protein